VDTAATSATSAHRHRNNLEEIAGDQSVYPAAGVTSRPVFRAPERARAPSRVLRGDSSESTTESRQRLDRRDPGRYRHHAISGGRTCRYPRRNRIHHPWLAGEQPPTNPLVVLKAARWWYIHGKGGTDPAFRFDGLSSGRGTSRPTRPATLSASTSSSSTSSRSASLTNPTNSGNRESGFCAPQRGAARPEQTQSP